MKTKKLLAIALGAMIMCPMAGAMTWSDCDFAERAAGVFFGLGAFGLGISIVDDLLTSDMERYVVETAKKLQDAAPEKVKSGHWSQGETQEKFTDSFLGLRFSLGKWRTYKNLKPDLPAPEGLENCPEYLVPESDNHAVKPKDKSLMDWGIIGCCAAAVVLKGVSYWCRPKDFPVQGGNQPDNNGI